MSGDKVEAFPSIAVVADSDLNRYVLKNLLQDAGYRVDCCIDSGQLDRVLDGERSEVFDAWLVDLDEEQALRVLDQIDDCSAAPCLMNDEIPAAQDVEAYNTWQRRLLEKLEEVAVRSCDIATRGVSSDIEAVWVLAASTGGPEAVKRFLTALRPDLPLAMVYVQHIDANFDKLLTNTMGRSHAYPLVLCRGEHHLRAGQISVVPVDHQLRFLPFERVVQTRKTWQGPYRPAIDQVVAEVARLYRRRCGVIVFTGMLNDGEIGCRVVHACGGEVWVQSPETCVSEDMPRAALSTGAVSVQGTPEELAALLAEKYRPSAG